MLCSLRYRKLHRAECDEVGGVSSGEGSQGSLHTSDYTLNRVWNDEHTEEGKGSLGRGRKNRMYESTNA